MFQQLIQIFVRSELRNAACAPLPHHREGISVHSARRAVGLSLMCGARLLACCLPLLHDVCKLVGQEQTAAWRRRCELTRTEHNVVADGVCTGVHVP
jgi:hypothetical protein